jgi:aryl-alcohol dehydrogenase-like predicted oxidoreductase
MVRAWYSDDNFQRLARVNELAKKKNAAPINLALAYVLNQPSPTFALIGPRTLSETRTSLPALDIELTDAEMRWLNLET